MPRNRANLVSRALEVTTDYATITVEGLALKSIEGIQNNTAGNVYIKFGGGDGEFIIPAGGSFLEFYVPFIGVFEIKSTVAGSVCCVG